jgi:hypothetical protein
LRLKKLFFVLIYSENRFLVALDSVAVADLTNFRASQKKMFEMMLLSFRVYEKATKLVYSRQKDATEKTPVLLESLYSTGYFLLWSSEKVVEFLELVNKVFFLTFDEYLTKDDLTAIKLQCKQILKELKTSQSSNVPKPLKYDPSVAKHDLERFVRMTEHLIQFKLFIDNKDQITVGYLIWTDLLRITSLNRYDQISSFFQNHQFIPSAERLSSHLRNSVETRRYWIVDNDNSEDLSDVLDGAIKHFDELGVEESKQKVIGFYMLIKLSTENEGIARKAFRKLEKSREKSFDQAILLEMVAEKLQVPDLFNRFYRSILEKNRKGDRDYNSRRINSVHSHSSFIEIVAANFLLGYRGKLVSVLRDEFEKPEYDNFCRGSEEFRNFLKAR